MEADKSRNREVFTILHPKQLNANKFLLCGELPKTEPREFCNETFDTASSKAGMSFFMDRNKDQGEHVLGPEDAPPGAIVSPDTHRAPRIPPG